MHPELMPGSGFGTRKIQSWIRIRKNNSGSTTLVRFPLSVLDSDQRIDPVCFMDPDAGIYNQQNVILPDSSTYLLNKIIFGT